MRITVLVLLLLGFFSSFSQSFDEGLNQLNQNQVTEAKNSLIKLKADSKSASQSLLALSLIEVNSGHYDDASTLDDALRFAAWT